MKYLKLVPVLIAFVWSAAIADEDEGPGLSLIHISEPTRPPLLSRMPSSA